jgi:hypothetical protein
MVHFCEQLSVGFMRFSKGSMVQVRLRTPDLQGQDLRAACLNCNCTVWLYSRYLTQGRKLEAGKYVTEIMSY